MSRPRYLKINALSQAHMIELLLAGHSNNYEIAEETGLSKNVVDEYTNALHKRKVAYIVDWDLDSIGRAVIRVFKLGRGKDKPRPALKRPYHQERRERMAMAKMLGLMRPAA